MIKVSGKKNPAKGKRKKERIKVYGKNNPAIGTKRKKERKRFLEKELKNKKNERIKVSGRKGKDKGLCIRKR